MSIRVWGYLDEYAQEREEILTAVDGVFGSGQLVLGAQVSAFESEFAAHHGMSHCVGVDNGTNALVLALRAVGVGPGDEVITVSNTAAPTVVAIDAVGARAVFVDIDDHYLMDTTQLEGAVTGHTRCLLPVHLYGQCVSMAPLLEVARRHELVVVEDVAQAHGSRQDGILAGTRSMASAYSFYPTKVLGAYGDGGAVMTDDAETARALRRLRYYGMEEQYYVTRTPGYNSRLDEVQAAILRTRLRRLDSYIDGRRRVAARYADGLADTSLSLPRTATGNEHVYYLYVVRHPQRDEIIARLAEQDIHLNVSYPWPVHTMTGFAHLGYEPGSLPRTELAADEIFSLPMFPSLRVDDQSRVIDALRSVLDLS